MTSNTISKHQFMSIVVLFLLGSSFLISPGSAGKQDDWFVLILASLWSIGLFRIYASLNKIFPEDTIIEYLPKVFGEFIGSIITFFYINILMINISILTNIVSVIMAIIHIIKSVTIKAKFKLAIISVVISLLLGYSQINICCLVNHDVPETNSNIESSTNFVIKISDEESEKLFDEQLVTCSNSKIIVGDEKLKPLHPDVISTVVTNNSDKVVEDYTVGFLGYDSNWLPLKITLNNGLANYNILGHRNDANIISGASYRDNYGWQLYKAHGLSNVIACVESVKFYNGDTWENPYYAYWLKKYENHPINESDRENLSYKF